MNVPPRRWPEVARTLARTFGARGAALRAVHEARRASGAFRPRPRVAAPLGTAPPARSPFALDAEALRGATDVVAALARADRVVGGEYEAYRWTWRPLPPTPGGWLRAPGAAAAWPADASWWRLPHFDEARGDIKDVWEPARFGWVYDLVRAFALTRESAYAAAFHAHLARWLDASPPFSGPHWACGQETAIRAIALLHAEATLLDGASAEDAARLATVLAASGERIADAIGYAISQRNNHAISEAVGLIALGDRFRDAHPDAARWSRVGRRLLVRLVREQFAPDGWYAQHSFTYLRLALDQIVIAARVLRAAGERLPDVVAERARASAALLLALVDAECGVVPNHGASDGAFVHPITLAGYRDFRPLLTALGAVLDVAIPADVPLDAETLAWLGDPSPRRAPARRDGVVRGASGWAAARVAGWSVFLRAGTYESRPGHIDPLQVDVRRGARELVVDAGTFRYAAPAPWRNGLAGAAVHNGPQLAGIEHGVRGPRFLWLLWPRAAIVDATFDDRVATLVAELPGLSRRTVRVRADGVEVVDDVAPGVAPSVAVRWLLHPSAPDDSVTVVDGATRERGREGSTMGWFSPHYGERVATTTLTAHRPSLDGARIVTRVAHEADERTRPASARARASDITRQPAERT